MRIRHFAALAALGPLAAACGYRSSGGFPTAVTMRTAVDVPARFDPPPDFSRIAPADTIAGGACLSPMVDPRDGTALRMERAAQGRADYAVPEGRYGVGPGELLRIDCNTGAPVGIVRGEGS
jgi:hypothetical protein